MKEAAPRRRSASLLLFLLQPAAAPVCETLTAQPSSAPRRILTRDGSWCTAAPQPRQDPLLRQRQRFQPRSVPRRSRRTPPDPQNGWIRPRSARRASRSRGRRSSSAARGAAAGPPREEQGVDEKKLLRFLLLLQPRAVEADPEEKQTQGGRSCLAGVVAGLLRLPWPCSRRLHHHHYHSAAEVQGKGRAVAPLPHQHHFRRRACAIRRRGLSTQVPAAAGRAAAAAAVLPPFL